MKRPWPPAGRSGTRTPRTSAEPITSPRSSSPGDARSGTPCRRAQNRMEEPKERKTTTAKSPNAAPGPSLFSSLHPNPVYSSHLPSTPASRPTRATYAPPSASLTTPSPYPPTRLRRSSAPSARAPAFTSPLSCRPPRPPQASGQGLPPPATPKSATRSLLRSNSCDITPPVLSAMSEATPVSIEPRINIGSRYQAEVPELRQRSAVELDHHRAELVWTPLTELEEKPDFQQKVEDLMHLACSSVFCGGGTNQELAHHCLYECKGDIMAALSLLMLRNPIFPKSHHLANYHYSGSDSWTAAERRQFNKGITAYKKDFFMVQKQVATKSVAQCVEFYYTYKKHVKIGRNGTLTYGEAEPLESRTTEEETDHKGSHRLEPQPQEEDSRKWEGSADRKPEVGPTRVTHTQSTDNPGTVLIMKSQDDIGRDLPLSRVIQAPHPPPPSSKPRYDGNARRTSPSTGNKGTAGQEGEFPCKKCGRVFYKVKSRSAHMKSHAEQEKKAAALRQREAEERAAAKAAAEAAALPRGAAAERDAAAGRGQHQRRLVRKGRTTTTRTGSEREKKGTHTLTAPRSVDGDEPLL
ncbi:ELM2 and SANT domain-containing protein 1 [Larimichthys crocea]|uniref:Uncharacterized protein n=1 Tax=Larimichthys crocea TaxID=215358 RepID=A0ACD3RQN7_LARCR|nr:ELM2 and SANT domain-containing protein 1 [Larimichthys crocea]